MGKERQNKCHCRKLQSRRGTKIKHDTASVGEEGGGAHERKRASTRVRDEADRFRLCLHCFLQREKKNERLLRQEKKISERKEETERRERGKKKKVIKIFGSNSNYVKTEKIAHFCSEFFMQIEQIFSIRSNSYTQKNNKFLKKYLDLTNKTPIRAFQFFIYETKTIKWALSIFYFFSKNGS